MRGTGHVSRHQYGMRGTDVAYRGTNTQFAVLKSRIVVLGEAERRAQGGGGRGREGVVLLYSDTVCFYLWYQCTVLLFGTLVLHLCRTTVVVYSSRARLCGATWYDTL
eukprot:3878227-Rhodomonas_salina.4